MKKNLKLFIVIIILAIITFLVYKFLVTDNTKKNQKSVNYNGVIEYLSDIYGTTFLISEFDDINKADEDWLWENVNQYVLNHEDEYKEQNEQAYGYTYDDVSKIVKKIYGDDLKKSFPKGAVAMRYDSYREMYGPASYGIENYYDYKIDSIIKEGNTYTVSIYDYTVSLVGFLGDNPENKFKIFNNYDYMINFDNGTPILEVETLDDISFQNLLDKKDELSHKILTIEYDDASALYHIKSCKYEDTKDTDILATVYSDMQLTYEIMSIDYDPEDLYNEDEVIVNNFDELTSIYTENAIDTYKSEMDLFVYKDNGDVYITAGDITIRECLVKVEFKDVTKDNNQISCNVIRTFRKSFDYENPEYNEFYEKEDKFTIINQDGKWLVDEFGYNN